MNLFALIIIMSSHFASAGEFTSPTRSLVQRAAHLLDQNEQVGICARLSSIVITADSDHLSKLQKIKLIQADIKSARARLEKESHTPDLVTGALAQASLVLVDSIAINSDLVELVKSARSIHADLECAN